MLLNIVGSVIIVYFAAALCEEICRQACVGRFALDPRKVCVGALMVFPVLAAIALAAIWWK